MLKLSFFNITKIGPRQSATATISSVILPETEGRESEPSSVNDHEPETHPLTFKERLINIDYNFDLIPNCFICHTFTLELFEEPYTANNDPRQNFEKTFLEKWLGSHADSHPILHNVIASKEPNEALKNQIESFVAALENIVYLKKQLDDPIPLTFTDLDIENDILSTLTPKQKKHLLIEQNEFLLINIQRQLIAALKHFIELVTHIIIEQNSKPEENQNEIYKITKEYVLLLHELESHLGHTPIHLFDAPEGQSDSDDDELPELSLSNESLESIIIYPRPRADGSFSSYQTYTALSQSETITSSSEDEPSAHLDRNFRMSSKRF